MNYNTSNIRLLFIGSIIIVVHFFLGISLWWLAIPVTFHVCRLIYGSIDIKVGFYGETLCVGDKEKKEISITFDDGPNPEFTPKVLAVLAEQNIPAAFFVIGKNIEGNEDLLKRMDFEGHTIGNHSFSHSFFIDFKGKRGFMKEMNRTADKIYSVIGKRTKLFRPPYGVTTPGLTRAYYELDYSCIGWNFRSMDTTAKYSEALINVLVLAEVRAGSILLFHDSSDKTIAVLKETIKCAKEFGYKIVGLEQLLNIRAYE